MTDVIFVADSGMLNGDQMTRSKTKLVLWSHFYVIVSKVNQGKMRSFLISIILTNNSLVSTNRAHRKVFVTRLVFFPKVFSRKIHDMYGYESMGDSLEKSGDARRKNESNP